MKQQMWLCAGMKVPAAAKLMHRMSALGYCASGAGVRLVATEQRLRGLLAAFPQLHTFWAAAWECCQKKDWIASSPAGASPFSAAH